MTAVHLSRDNLSLLNYYLPMKIKNLLLLAVMSALLPFAAVAQSIANIDYGSAPALGGGLFVGTDGNSAESITLGYFSGSANADLTGWTALGTDTSFDTTGGFNQAALSGADVTSAVGKEAWILITDASLTGLVRANDWANISGAAAPSTPTTLTYTFDSGDSAATVTTLGSITITDNAGQGGSSGISMTIAVPEPGTYALIIGALALVWVAIRRR